MELKKPNWVLGQGKDLGIETGNGRHRRLENQITQQALTKARIEPKNLALQILIVLPILTFFSICNLYFYVITHRFLCSHHYSSF